VHADQAGRVAVLRQLRGGPDAGLATQHLGFHIHHPGVNAAVLPRFTP